MNIGQAKQEILNTIEAYLTRDETGEYAIPTERQRPILLMGPPGIGKTAIMEQVAQEAHINLVSYTITHHTRQSAIGLPYISRRNYGGKEYSVTEYTMSEIIASVYDQIERSGIQEGILFLDEINCVSETRAPTMLQFLQYKTFGTHRVPDGFLIVTAGNPPQYNKSVRDFDIVTLDRVKRIDIDVDYGVWKEYARRQGVHGSIPGYLDIRKDHFYRIRNEAENRYFVTARGWEDLSRIMKVYEKIGKPVTKELALQYLQDPEIAEGFATYYALWNKYRTVYQIPRILDGSIQTDPAAEEKRAELSEAPFDEKLSVLSLLIDTLNGEFRQYAEDRTVQQKLFGDLRKVKEETAHRKEADKGGAPEEGSEETAHQIAKSDAAAALRQVLAERTRRLEQTTAAGLLPREDEHTERLAIAAEQTLLHDLEMEGRKDFDAVRGWFADRETRRTRAAAGTREHLTNALDYLAHTFGEGQEMVLFLTELAGGFYSLKFVNECGCVAYFHYHKLLLLGDRRKELQAEIMAL